MRRLIILWIVVFMILVILHELGHFTAARKCWMKVPEFWIWIPPKICNLRKDRQGTQFTLNWIPLGWFCSIEWEDPTDKKSFENPNTLFTAKLWKRLIVIFAWVTMNFLTAWIILTGLFWHGLEPISVSQIAEDKGSTSYLMASSSFLREKWFLTWETTQWVIVGQVEENSFAESIGLQQEDILLSVDWTEIRFSNFADLMASWADQSHFFLVQRGEDLENIVFTCEWACKFWITILENGNITVDKIKFGLWWAMVAWLHEIWAEWDLTMKILWDLWRALVSFSSDWMKTAFDSLSGPVWAVYMWRMLYQAWWRAAFLAFAAMISIALWIFNVLPIPALDGWRALWMIIQRAFKIKPEKYFKYESYVNAFFFYLLLLLWIVLIVKDLIVFWWINIPFIG